MTLKYLTQNTEYYIKNGFHSEDLLVEGKKYYDESNESFKRYEQLIGIINNELEIK